MRAVLVIAAGAVLLSACGRLNGAPATSEPSGLGTPLDSAQPSLNPTPIATATSNESQATQHVDRPGVPADLYDRYWFSRGIVGSVGTTASQELPSGEELLDVADGFLASAIWLRDGRSPSQILIRRFGGVDVVRTIDTDVWVLRGVIVDGTLFWTGPLASDSTTDSLLDGGVWAVDLASTTAPVAVIPSGADMSAFATNGLAERTPFVVSPTHGTMSSTIGGANGSRADIIDLRSLSVRATLDETVVAVSDDVAIAYRDASPVRLAAVGIDTGRQQWRFPDAGDEVDVGAYLSTFMMDDDLAFSFEGLRDGVEHQFLFLIDLDTGASRSVLIQEPGIEWLYLIPRLSTQNHLALSTRTSIQDALSDFGNASVTLLEPQSGTLTQNAFRIDLR